MKTVSGKRKPKKGKAFNWRRRSPKCTKLDRPMITDAHPEKAPPHASVAELLQESEAAWRDLARDGIECANISAVAEGCSFASRALENFAALSEAEGAAALSILARADGDEIAQAATCQHIEQVLFHNACQQCPFHKRLTSPIDLEAREPAMVRLLKSHAYVRSIDRFVDLSDAAGQPLTRTKVRNFNAGAGLSGHADERLLHDSLALKAHDRVWRPDLPQGVFNDAGKVMLNTYSPPRHGSGSVEPVSFLKHLEYLLPIPEERAIVLQSLAHLVQRPGDKITYAIVLLGPQGCGKTYFIKLMSKVLGEQNVWSTQGRSLDAKFRGHWACRVMLGMEEVHSEGSRRTYNDLKTLISNDTDEFDTKFRRPEIQVTPRGILLCTNSPDALYLPADDRRFFVCQCADRHPSGDAYYRELFADLESPAFVGAVYRLLSDVDLTSFDAKHPPFDTAAKLKMQESSRPDVEVAVADLLEGGEEPFDIDLIPLGDALDAVKRGMRAKRLSDKSIRQALAECGLPVDTQGRQCRLGGRRVRMCIRDPERYEQLSAAELAVAYAELRWPTPSQLGHRNMMLR